MKLALIFVLLFASRAISQEDAKSVARQYLPFQGEWRLIAQDGGASKEKDLPEIVVTVTGQQFELSGSGIKTELPMPLEFRVPAKENNNPYRDLKKRGAKKLDDIIDVKNQIAVFWFVGIFKLSGDELQLALKYCGQGVEGIHFETFRPPSSFDRKPTDGELRVTLKRQTNSGASLQDCLRGEWTALRRSFLSRLQYALDHHARSQVTRLTFAAQALDLPNRLNETAS